MLGTCRLFLALLVACSHTGLSLAGLNPGVMAVVGFYLISGYVMAGLMARHYNHPHQATSFYLDRAIRLLPQYLFYMVLTLGWQLYSQINTQFLTRLPSFGDLLNNLLVVPLNYYMFNDSDQFTLIPPAWSLGAEMQFYMLAPFVLLRPKIFLAVGLVGLGAYVASLIGLVNSEWFGYRLLPGVLLFFLAGAYLQKLHRQQCARVLSLGFPVLLVLTAAMGVILLRHHEILHQPYKLETLLGFMIGLVLLTILGTQKQNRLDNLAGDLSYGVFLNHFFIMWLLYPQGVATSQLAGFLVLSTALSWLTHRYVERPLLKRRYILRQRVKLTSF